MKLQLTPTERLLLSNQYAILGKLYPDEAPYFAEAREIVDSGYEGMYSHLTRSMSEEALSDEECTEVLNVMTMFSCLKDAYEGLADKSGINPDDVRFEGFDGNN